jgi:predicted TIM-barrel fold metal-dependent hydrolase
VGRGSVNCYTRAGLAEEPEPGIFRAANARYRCEDMDRDGVDAELVNGPYEQISAIKDPELRAACVRAANDWARELYEESNGRFIMLLPLPCQTPGEAVAELMRVAEFGLPSGVIFDWVGAPEPVLHQMWEPVWAAAAETRLPINLHANPRGGSRQIGVGVSGLEPRNQSLMTGLDSPWPHSKAMGHAPAEAALGKEALNQLVFENAVSLYKIPVTLPQGRAYRARGLHQQGGT